MFDWLMRHEMLVIISVSVLTTLAFRLVIWLIFGL